MQRRRREPSLCARACPSLRALLAREGARARRMRAQPGSACRRSMREALRVDPFQGATEAGKRCSPPLNADDEQISVHSQTRAHARTHARSHAHTHTHTHSLLAPTLPCTLRPLSPFSARRPTATWCPLAPTTQPRTTCAR
eukprot:3075126-Pleurochrysis_carterae.AAC.1